MISLDFETASELDLRLTGAYTYARSSRTRVLCLCWREPGRPAKEWRIGSSANSTPLLSLLDAVASGAKIGAHNAEFEWVIWNNVFLRQLGISAPALSLDQLECTMARCLYHGLPAALDDVGHALGLPPELAKDTHGQSLMMRMNKPRTRNADGSAASWWHEDEPERLDRLVGYCHRDTLAEMTVASRVPPLPEPEQKLWRLNCEMNAAGIGVDASLVEAMKRTTITEKKRLDQHMAAITNGEVKTVNQAAKLTAWLQSRGVDVTNVAKGTLQQIKHDDPLVRDVVATRLEAAKSSTAKLDKIETVRGGGDVLQGLVAYYGAGRTGRYAGRLCQPHNFPRGTLKKEKYDAAIQMFLTGVPSGDNATTMLDTVSSCLRGVFVPVRRRATHLAVGDFAQIEARMIAWLAGQQDILDVFARGEDVYVYAAARVGSDNRQLGKANTLALGFGMGAARFVKTAKDYGLVFTEREAQRNVSEWREANGCIVRLWYDFERAAREVLWSRGPKAVAVTNRIVIGTEVWNGTRHLWVQLPSGRRLWYYDAQIIEDRISYQGLNSVTRKWEREETWGGTLAQNATQAAARDVMARALYRINEAKGVLRPLMSVHDEIINEFDEQHIAPDDAKALLKTFMVNAPRWADGLPLAADVFTATRYRK